MKLPLFNILRTSKVFAVVLGLHLFVLSLLLFHPGCQSGSRAGDASVSPMGETTAYDHATLAEPQRPSDTLGSDTSGTYTSGLNDAPMVDSHYSLNEPSGATTTPMAATQATGGTSYTVKKGDSLWSIARRHGVSMHELAMMNGLSKTSTLRVGQILLIPASSGIVSAANSTDMDSANAALSNTTESHGTYRVKSGDTLGQIAKANGISVRALKSANGLSSDIIRVGQKLKIPSGKAVVEPARTPASASSAPAATSSYDMAPVSMGSTSTEGTLTHKVASGESPAIIAKKYGMKTSELIALNNITDPRKLRIGQELKVSSPTAPAAEAIAAAEASTPMSVEALEAATGTTTDSTAPVVEVPADATTQE